MQNLGLFQITLAGADGFLALCPLLSGQRTEFNTLFGSEIIGGLNRARRTSGRSNRVRLSIMNTALAELRHAEIACDLIEPAHQRGRDRNVIAPARLARGVVALAGHGGSIHAGHPLGVLAALKQRPQAANVGHSFDREYRPDQLLRLFTSQDRRREIAGLVDHFSPRHRVARCAAHG
jgi:hypothetical protein